MTAEASAAHRVRRGNGWPEEPYKGLNFFTSRDVLLFSDSEPRPEKQANGLGRRDPSPSRNCATLQQSQCDSEAERQKKRDEAWQACADLAGEPRIVDR